MPDAVANHGTNQRVSNALLGQKIDQLTETSKDGFASVNKRLDRVEERLGASDVSDATSAEWRRQHEKEHSEQRKAGRIELGIAALVAAAAGVGIKVPWQGP